MDRLKSFKVGDRVKYVGKCISPKGTLGTVTDLYLVNGSIWIEGVNSHYIRVDFDKPMSGRRWWNIGDPVEELENVSYEPIIFLPKEKN